MPRLGQVRAAATALRHSPPGFRMPATLRTHFHPPNPPPRACWSQSARACPSPQQRPAPRLHALPVWAALGVRALAQVLPPPSAGVEAALRAEVARLTREVVEGKEDLLRDEGALPPRGGGVCSQGPCVCVLSTRFW